MCNRLLLAASITIVVGSLALSSCNSRQKGNCREQFEKNYDVNVKAFMSTMPNADPVLARQIAEAELNKAYEIDSTFVLLEGAQLHEFLQKHQIVFERVRDSYPITQQHKYRMTFR